MTTDQIRATCTACGGSGEIVTNADWPHGTGPYSEKCPACSGARVVVVDREIADAQEGEKA